MRQLINFEKMSEKADKLGISLSNLQLEALDIYTEMLVDWNTRMNLTGITDSDGIMTRHLEDSMTLLCSVDIAENASVIDVGTGAGFPGMVLKIVRPDIQLTLLDSLNKRITFLNTVAMQLNLKIDSLHMRAEEGGKKSAYREKFDIACARAVADLRVLSEYCMPYVSVGGMFIAMKGPDVQNEIDLARQGIGTLGGKVINCKELSLSDGSHRSIISIQKVRSTPPQFPRLPAKIQKKPL